MSRFLERGGKGLERLSYPPPIPFPRGDFPPPYPILVPINEIQNSCNDTVGHFVEV